ncbi:TetR/AcrR family transcriptional regulator [Catenulispora sp. NL8]|uniref:TetR/AcrR family transcriptional regulator n=1 Tax=Catenulispora pinistramenti TaxID=2705254 RepID=A0ABS5KPP3_9ACTN|nr:TetR family transcriptional regulator [Catenulispora pinistramenti]MBS2548017.1 TetR/AcrR family transcriptional regulator [Catenulispora pinistramenti]
MATHKADQRREAGQRTKDALVAATLEQLAQRGREGLTLREVTDSAGANVAAVSYHFGSLKGLCDAAIEHALERYLDAQIQSLESLTPASGLEDVARAFAAPMVHALAAGGQELVVMRTVARIGIDPPRGWDRLAGKFEQTRRDTLRALRANLPGVGEPEAVFRTRAAAGLLNWLALAPIGAELAAGPAEEIERLVVPVVAGAFRGLPAAG